MKLIPLYFKKLRLKGNRDKNSLFFLRNLITKCTAAHQDVLFTRRQLYKPLFWLVGLLDGWSICPSVGPSLFKGAGGNASILGLYLVISRLRWGLPGAWMWMRLDEGAY